MTSASNEKSRSENTQSNQDPSSDRGHPRVVRRIKANTNKTRSTTRRYGLPCVTAESG